MCKYKDVNIGIKKLSKSQREDYMIMDDQYFSFEAISRIYSVKDVLKY